MTQKIKWLSDRSYEVMYSGVVNYPLRNTGKEKARGLRDTAGIIGPDGVYLDSGSGWYPLNPAGDGARVTFDLKVHLPPGWDAVSQGRRTEHTHSENGTVTRWVCDVPQEGIWLVAGRYEEYTKRSGGIVAMAFLRQPDLKLAETYLQATGEYIRMYERLIGPYPYGKFALVENFWETGYGMPSFTLLGPRVIRFPFIIETSYPHEILHNWWGNGVFIDYQSGNWGEGLTAYLSDHLLKEQKGLGAQHRRESLQKYADYVFAERDIPLTEFRSRHGSVTEAVGYGKTMMMFHMLRLELGDELFRRGLRRFYADNLYKRAAFRQVREAFEAVSERDLGMFFDQWVLRSGAPVLKLDKTAVKPLAGGGFELKLVLSQDQGENLYDMDVPVAVTLDGREDARLLTVPVKESVTSTAVNLPARPVRVDVDPRFDLFRRLDRREIPPALTSAFGARKAIVLLPAAAAVGLRSSYRDLARALAQSGPGEVDVMLDTELSGLPLDASVWVLGWDNRLLPDIIQAFEDYRVRLDVAGGLVRIDDEGIKDLKRDKHSIILTGRHTLNQELAVTWIGAQNAAAHPGLARKLPHYHKYSYLAFTGDEPENFVKGRWPVVNSPLTAYPDGKIRSKGNLPARKPLIER
jgi:hypothetical protein